jgi:cbb3-type cytochrome oxidase subunit 1
MRDAAVSFVKVSMAYLMAGATLGTLLLFKPLPYMAAHAHLLLIGWMGMVIFGVGYHLFPVFAGQLLHSKKLAEAHFYLQNLGLLGLAATFHLQNNNLKMFFGGLSLLGMYMFSYNILMTFYKKQQ